MPATWTQADVDTLKAAIVGGVKEVEYAGPPKRRVVYQDLPAMRALLADMVRAVAGTDAPAYRRVTYGKGFRE